MTTTRLAVNLCPPTTPRAERENLTEWVDVIAFSERARHLLEQTRKGDLVEVTGGVSKPRCALGDAGTDPRPRDTPRTLTSSPTADQSRNGNGRRETAGAVQERRDRGDGQAQAQGQPSRTEDT